MLDSDTKELKVIDDLYLLILWSHEHVLRFPRNARYTLGSRIESQLIAILDLLIEAKFSRVKAELLENANIELEKLRFWFRFAKDTKAISIKSHEHAIHCLVAISKQVTGWSIHSRSNDRVPRTVAK